MGFSASVFQPSTLRMLIWPEASKAQNNIAAVSAEGSTVCVLIRRLNSSCSRSIALVVRALFHCSGGRRVDRRYPGEPRFPGVATLIQVHSTTEQAGKTTRETRTYISSAPLDIDRIAAAIRGHWGVESMHWILDVQFKDDLSRYRQGHGAKNMAVVRRFALDLVRAYKAKGSVKTRRLIATWSPEFLLKVLSL